MRFRITVLCALVGTMAAVPAVAATTIRGEGTKGGASTMYIEHGRVAMSNGQRVTVFDASTNHMVFIDGSRHAYQVVDEQQMAKLASQMQQMREQMEQQLENLPEAQRKAMREQMGSMLPGASQPPRVRIERGGSGSVGGYACTKATVYLDGEARHDVCVASLDTVGMSTAEYQALTGMFSFFGKMYGKVSAGEGELGPRTTERLMKELDGMPIQSKDLKTGSAWQIREISHGDIPADTFEVPAGYKQEDAFGG